MYHYGSPLLRRFAENELDLSPKESNPASPERKGRFPTFLFFGGIAILLAIPVYKGFALWQDTRSDTYQEAPLVELISNRGVDTSNVSSSDEPIKPDQTFLTEKQIAVDEIPTRILIPSLSIDLEITPSKVVNGYWEISETSASFGLGSAPPGEVGNSVIFAHARAGFFLPLRKIKKDTMVYVLTKSGWYSYKVEEIKTVKPTEVEVISPTADEVLTLYTCSGFADTKRLIVKAKRTS